MTRARRQLVLVLLSVAALSVAVVVFVLNRDAVSHLLGGGLAAVAIAIVVLSVPPADE